MLVASVAERTPDSGELSRAQSFVTLGYPREVIESTPVGLLGSSFPSGCPVAAIQPRPGERIVDIGAGGGLDCFLLKQIAPAGVTVVGVDISAISFQHARALGATLLERISFVAGDGQSLPIATESVDWVTANGSLCVVPEPERVVEEAFRVLRPGGRLAVGFLLASLPGPLSWLARGVARIRGGRTENQYIEMLVRQGFRKVRVRARHDYSIDQARHLWGTVEATRRLLRWGRAPYVHLLTARVMRCFQGVDLSAVKPRTG